jgi:hypothetical protein
MLPDQIDEHLEAVLRAAGTSLRHYSMPSTRDAMRSAMAKARDEAAAVMREEYLNASADAMKFAARVKMLEEVLTDVQFMLDDHRSPAAVLSHIRTSLKEPSDA